MILSFNIPDDKVQRIVDAMNGLHERPEAFTEPQWAKECVRRFVIKSVSRWETSKAQERARISQDDSLITVQE